MAYLLKYVDEYGETGYYDDFNEKLVEFKTIDEAEEKAEELLDMEYEDFCSAITKYYIVEVGTKALKEIKSFKLAEDLKTKECVLSCTSNAVDQLKNAFEEAKKVYICDVTEDRTYDNGSKVLKFKYEKRKQKEEEKDYEVVIIHSDNTFTLGFDVEKAFIELNMLARVLLDKYKEKIVLYNSERRNNAGTISFTLSSKDQEEFKKDLIKGTEIFFKVKLIEK